ncbi:ABC transporter ATP-binding protein [Mediterraneibacter sp. ICN-202921]|uniref:ABC transporter ATP-binding protein n=1 Tax=Mediterraneibacter sp. ICN-202921 TaxID=3134657 RepID=UPI0030C1598B
MLRINAVQKQYGKFMLQCSMEVKPGYVTGLIGPNGAGKTTVFKAVLGLLRIDGGTIEIGGKDNRILTNREKAEMGVVLSDSGFSEYLSVKEIIRIMENMYPYFHKEQFLEQCEQFCIPLNKKVKAFSTGMKAKLKLLLAMSHEAKILLLDEPTAGLDVAAREEMLDILREYMEKGEERAILISSHISGDLEGLCDDLYMLKDGQIILHEETDRLLDRYAVIKVDEEQFKNLDTQYILRKRKEAFGYQLLTEQKQYYMENYPRIVIENVGIDEVVLMMMKGETL